MNSKPNLNEFKWLNPPKVFSLVNDKVLLNTEPETDFWQRTFYGFRNDNAPAFLTNVFGDFTFVVKVEFETKNRYDQCGIVLYQNADNWMKASIEFENAEYARLGSVVTNLGYSDWATTDVSPAIRIVWYRLSRRTQDFYIEYSLDGENYVQMRIFHMHNPIVMARIGVYACSPVQSSFKAEFSEFGIGRCIWQDHS